MIILSSSLPKSGSTLIARMQEDLLSLCVPRNGQEKLREAFNGMFIEKLTRPIVLKLLYLHAHHGTLVIKTHSRPSWEIRMLIRSGLARATFCYRDPRDVILSSIDHCRRDAEAGKKDQPFSDYTSFKEALPRVRMLANWWRAWRKFGHAHFIQYEAMMADKVACVRDMCTYLGWRVTDQQIAELLRRHVPKKGVTHNFNKGISFRYRTEMSAAEIAEATDVLRDMIEAYGYEAKAPAGA